MISCLVIALLAVTASAADFKLDPMCTQPLAPAVDSSKCCRIPEVIDDKIMEKCAIKVFGVVPPSPSSPSSPSSPPMSPPMSPPPPPPPQSGQQSGEAMPGSDMLFAPAIRCLAECIFNESGILKDRVLQPDVAINQAKGLLQQSEQEWIPAFETSIKSCKEFVSKITFDDQKMCGHTAAYLIGCFNTQLFKNCPASKWKDENGCAQLRSSTDKCPVLPSLMQTQQ